MFHKYKQNITFNVINSQIHIQKRKLTKKYGVGHFSIGGSIVYYIILTSAYIWQIAPTIC